MPSTYFSQAERDHFLYHHKFELERHQHTFGAHLSTSRNIMSENVSVVTLSTNFVGFFLDVWEETWASWIKLIVQATSATKLSY